MTMDAQTDPRRNFVPRLLPWLLAAVALVVYLSTLNYWVSLFNLTAVARTSGWMWQPQVYNPVSFARDRTVSLAAGGADSAGAKSVFRGVRSIDVGVAGAVGGPAAT